MTIPLQAADRERRRRLVRMKAIAAGLLVVMAVVFVVCWLLQDRHPAFGYVRAAAEAGMVGALADWFAVTALFRRPMGLPIPHTAIIPNRKEAIGSALSDFVATNFVSEEVVRDKLSRFNIAQKLGGWLAEQRNATRVTTELASAVRGVLDALSDEKIAALLSDLVRTSVADTRVGPPVGRVVADVLERGEHRPLVDFVIDRCYSWVRSNKTAITTIVSARAPGWSPRLFDSMVSGRVYDEVLTFARAIKADPQHPLRRALDSFLADFARDLQTDPTVMKRADAVAERIVGNAQVRMVTSSAWASIKQTLLDAADDPSSALQQAAADGLAAFGARLARDPVIGKKVNAAVSDAAGYLAANHARTVTGIIDETIARWDGAATARTIELHIGKDLQFIRINGTVVGALAGLAIYSVAQLVLG